MIIKKINLLLILVMVTFFVSINLFLALIVIA